MATVPFVGRENELARLEDEYARGNAFIVIYGRRRVGKTTLIKEFIQDKPALYFLASKEDEKLNLRRFARKAAEFTGNTLLATASFDNWRIPFQAIAQAYAEKPCVVAIDEFPYLITGNQAMPSIVQGVWDELLSGTGVTLILCGSSISMMHDEVLSQKSPLYGRRTSQIRLRPLGFAETRQAFPSATYEQAVETYVLTGGVPRYFEFFDPERGFMENIKRNVLSTSGYLYQEPEFLLTEETRGTASYLSILSAVAQGNRKISEITNFLGKRAQDVTPYLSTLISLGFLERRVPFNERYPERSKNGLYTVSDSFMRFWLTYVQPFAGELEMGNMEPSLEAIERTFETAFVPFAFERIASEEFASLCLAGEIPFTPSCISGFWNRSGSVELDVCANDNGAGRTFLGECKYHRERPVGMDEYRRLAGKVGDVPCLENGTMLGLFSHTGFSDELMQLAREDRALVLVDKGVRVA